MLRNFLEAWPSWLAVLLLLYWLGVAIVVLTDEREPTETLAWLLVLYALPGIGLLRVRFFQFRPKRM